MEDLTKMTEKQKKLINLLLDKYENSKSYQGNNVRQQSFSVNPDLVYSEYTDPLTDVDVIYSVEQEIKQLENLSLVMIKTFKNRQTINKVTLCIENVSKCYELTDRTEVKDINLALIESFSKWKDSDMLPISMSTKEQIDRILNGKKPSCLAEEFDNACKLITYMLSNSDCEILIREVSIELFANSKKIDEALIKRVCDILVKYDCVDSEIMAIEDIKERNRLIFETYGIYFNESLIRVKGKATIYLKDGRTWELRGESFVLTDSTLRKVDRIVVADTNVITVENLTSYNRISCENSFFLYLGGYHSKSKQLFIKNLANNNPDKSWKHFGDIDPDGFYILENLSKKTGVLFEPWLMSVDELKKYQNYAKPLGVEDIKKANKAIKDELYVEVISYMIENNIKLEQEIISRNLMKN